MKAPISEVGNRPIVCPECQHAGARVEPATRRLDVVAGAFGGGSLIAHAWFLADCPRSGKRLWPLTTMVELIPSP
jgi:hypothetical protein